MGMQRLPGHGSFLMESFLAVPFLMDSFLTRILFSHIFFHTEPQRNGDIAPLLPVSEKPPCPLWLCVRRGMKE